MTELERFDKYLLPSGPAALVVREYLLPVEGVGGVIYPAAYAPKQKGSPSEYSIDSFEHGNLCSIDSVGSQANRVEPMFKDDPYKSLVPQIVVKAGEKEINLLDTGHRAGDAIMRCSELQPQLHDAFEAVLKGSAEKLAQIAPTSLVFGVWDSRGTQAKLPRLIASTIRAYNVRKLTRSAQYVSAARYIDPEAVSALKEVAPEKALSERGFLDAPATGSPGGVIADGSIRREATLALAALKLLKVSGDDDRTFVLRRYILGLALTAFTHRAIGYLRQGCLLVLDPEPSEPHEFSEVYPDGTRKPCNVTHEECLAYAQVAATAFGVGKNQSVYFDRALAEKDALRDGEGKKAKKEKAAK